VQEIRFGHNMQKNSIANNNMDIISVKNDDDNNNNALVIIVNLRNYC